MGKRMEKERGGKRGVGEIILLYLVFVCIYLLVFTCFSTGSADDDSDGDSSDRIEQLRKRKTREFFEAEFRKRRRQVSQERRNYKHVLSLAFADHQSRRWR